MFSYMIEICWLLFWRWLDWKYLLKDKYKFGKSILLLGLVTVRIESKIGQIWSFEKAVVSVIPAKQISYLDITLVGQTSHQNVMLGITWHAPVTIIWNRVSQVLRWTFYCTPDTQPQEIPNFKTFGLQIPDPQTPSERSIQHELELWLVDDKTPSTNRKLTKSL